jgi:serine/threonine protein kinase/Tol biopolymer transport system component
MTPERWRQVEEIYHAALEREPGQRAALLAQADPEVRKEVESLLAQASGDGLLDHPAADLLGEPSVTQLAAGSQLGPYKIEAPIGAGGMGEVFRATDTRLRRTVAIKILPKNKVADPQRKQRFLQEARAASALNHPNIVTLHDIASDAGVDYLVMECVPGKSLDKLIPPKGLPLVEALNYVQQIASGLAAAHAAGIVHRDMKPGNVIVTPDAQVKILDFGLAKLAERAPGAEGETQTLEAALTQAGTVMGTVAYMSPEQAGGKPLDHRTDIFSLGIMLYEMLAGARRFRGGSQVETMHAIMHDPVPALTRQSPELGEILDKALAKNPKDRYQHAGDLDLDLRRFQKAWEAKSLPSMRDTPALSAQRRIGWGMIGSIAAVVLAAALGTAWLFAHRDNGWVNPLADAQFTRLTDFEGSETDAAISRDGRFAAFRSDRDGPVDTWVTQIGSGHFVNLTHGTQAVVLVGNTGFSPDGSEIWLSSIPGGARLRLVPSMGGNPRAFLTERAMEPAWSPDGSRVVYQTSDPLDPVYIADRAGGSPKQIYIGAVAGTHNHFLTWSKDGQWIYFVSGAWNATEMDIWRIRPSGENPERLTHIGRDLRYLKAFDNQTLLYAAPDQNGAGPWLWAFDIERKESHLISSGLEVFSSVDVSADGRRLVATVSNPTANLWSFPLLDRPAEERDVKRYNMPSVRAFAPRYGGKALFYLSSSGGGDGLWRFGDGQVVEIWKGSDGTLREPTAVSLDGRRVAVILRKQGKRTLNVLSADGGDIRPVGESIDVTSPATWSSDGNWIAAGGDDGTGPGLFKIPVGGGQPIRLTKGVASNPVWSPDGSLIVYTGPIVSSLGPIKLVRPDGSPVEAPAVQVRVGGERCRFVPGSQQLVYLAGSVVSKANFWLIDLVSKKSRQLSNFDSAGIRTFDISPDGKEIVFDKLRENSDIVLIELSKTSK